MHTINEAKITFRNGDQWRHYAILGERTISPTCYPDFPSLVYLGLAESVRFMFDQISWERFLIVKHPTYKNLTLEFLSSFNFQPNLGAGLDRGLATFRIFS